MVFIKGQARSRLKKSPPLQLFLTLKPVMAEQKALVIPAPSSPYTLTSRPIPVPGPGQVLVRIRGAALNPAEWKVAAYSMDIGEYPWNTGTDGAGVVEEVGEGVTNLKKGDRV